MIEIDGELLAALRLAAEEQGRAEREVLEEAVRSYLRREVPDALGEVPTGRPHGKDGFVALLERMSGRFGLDEEEAMEIAVEEQHAWRRERREREGYPPSP